MSNFVTSSFGWLTWTWVGILLLAVLAELAWLYVVVLRSWDLNHDKQRCHDRNVNWRKAQRRRVSWPQLGFPLFVLFGVLLVLLNLNTNIETYLVIATLWFVTAPLRRMWGLAVARKIVMKLDGKLTTSYWEDVSDYYTWGFTLPQRPKNKQWFEDKLAWMNKFQNLWYAVQIVRFWGVLAQAIAALAWPLSALVAIFYHMEMVDDYDDYYRPWWRFDRKSDRVNLDKR